MQSWVEIGVATHAIPNLPRCFTGGGGGGGGGGGAAARNTPFFANVWFHTPHLPVVVGPEYMSMYSDTLDDFHRSYYGVISAMDEQVGRLIAMLNELNVLENTFVSFTSDNGPEVRTPGSAGIFKGRKRTLHEGGIRVPSIMFYPKGGLIGGRRISSITSTSDYMPLILNGLLELHVTPVDETFDGINILPMLTDPSMARGKPLGFQSPRVGGLLEIVPGMLVWMDGDYKLVGIERGGSSSGGSSSTGKSSSTDKELNDYEWTLYNLKSDPSEANNIAGAHKDKINEMKNALKTWQRSCARSDNNRLNNV